MNTKARIRLLPLVLAFALVSPAVASADSIPIAYVIYQNNPAPGEPPDANPGTNVFYFGWLVDQLVFIEASFSVSGFQADETPIWDEASSLLLPLEEGTVLGPFDFLTTDSLTDATFRGTLASGVFALDGQTYSVVAQPISGGMTAELPGLRPLGLSDSYDFFVLEAQADPIPVPVPEGGPGTLGLTTLAALLAAARWRLDR